MSKSSMTTNHIDPQWDRGVIFTARILLADNGSRMGRGRLTDAYVAAEQAVIQAYEDSGFTVDKSNTTFDHQYAYIPHHLRRRRKGVLRRAAKK